MIFLTAKSCKQRQHPATIGWADSVQLECGLLYSRCCVASVASDSAAPQTAAPQAPRPWDSPGENTGEGCHFLLQCVKVESQSEVAQSCPTPSGPMDRKPIRLLHPWDFPGKSTGVGCHCLLQNRKLENIYET